MARGINKVILIGNLGNDPEVRYTPNGVAVTNISVATSMSWRDKQSGEMQDRTEWHRVVFFNRLAEIVGEYLRKGSKIYIEGSLRTRKWQDKSGADRYTTEIVGSEMQMLDSRNGGNSSSSSSSSSIVVVVVVVVVVVTQQKTSIKNKTIMPALIMATPIKIVLPILKALLTTMTFHSRL